MYQRIASLLILGLLLLGSPLHDARAQDVIENVDRIVEIGPTQRIIMCVGDTRTITVTVKVYDPNDDPPGFTPEGGTNVGTITSGDTAEISYPEGSSTDPATGQIQLAITGLKVGRSTEFEFIGGDGDDEAGFGVSKLIVLVRAKKDKPKGGDGLPAVNNINEELQKLYGSFDAEALRRSIATIRAELTKAPLGNAFNARVRDNALAELSAINRTGPHGVLNSDMEATLAALEALWLDTDALISGTEGRR